MFSMITQQEEKHQPRVREGEVVLMRIEHSKAENWKS